MRVRKLLRTTTDKLDCSFNRNNFDYQRFLPVTEGNQEENERHYETCTGPHDPTYGQKRSRLVMHQAEEDRGANPVSFFDKIILLATQAWLVGRGKGAQEDMKSTSIRISLLFESLLGNICPAVAREMRFGSVGAFIRYTFNRLPPA